MGSWREQLWVKIVAITIAGVFLFSEVTWAARANFSLSLPQFPLDHESGNVSHHIKQNTDTGKSDGHGKSSPGRITGEVDYFPEPDGSNGNNCHV